MDTKTQFSKNVIKLILMIPKGKVATYGQIAKLAGSPRGARGVGWLLHSSTHKHKLPWQRVIKANGHLPFPPNHSNHALQKRLLKKEGVSFTKNLVNLKKHRWPPSLNVQN